MAVANVPADKPVADDVLQCPLCLHPLESPVTLQQCLHTYCKACLNEMPQTSKYNVTGWMCPRCNRFLSKENVKENDFIEKVIECEKVYLKLKDPLTCKQCSSETDVKWWCSDCKIELCSTCHVNHIKIPMLKHHMVVEHNVSNADNNIVDELLFYCVNTSYPMDNSLSGRRGPARQTSEKDVLCLHRLGRPSAVHSPDGVSYFLPV